MRLFRWNFLVISISISMLNSVVSGVLYYVCSIMKISLLIVLSNNLIKGKVIIL